MRVRVRVRVSGYRRLVRVRVRVRVSGYWRLVRGRGRVSGYSGKGKCVWVGVGVPQLVVHR